MRRAMVSLDAVGEQAVLAEPVCDDHGQVLLPAGTHLTEGMVASLRRRGVATLVIVAPDPQPQVAPATDTRPLQAQVDERVQRLFRHTVREGNINPLQYMISRYRLGEFP
ncbi:MAG: hypothetical protein V4684_04205 [Pseudomonadota bacterium]